MNELQRDHPVPACPYCGGDRFTEGEAAVFGNLQFAPRLSGGRRPAPKPVHARQCDQCGNLQFFVPVPANRR